MISDISQASAKKRISDSVGLHPRSLIENVLIRIIPFCCRVTVIYTETQQVEYQDKPIHPTCHSETLACSSWSTSSMARALAT